MKQRYSVVVYLLWMKLKVGWSRRLSRGEEVALAVGYVIAFLHFSGYYVPPDCFLAASFT